MYEPSRSDTSVMRITANMDDLILPTAIIQCTMLKTRLARGVEKPLQHTRQRAMSHMATDYDAPRKQDDEIKSDSIEQLKASRSQAQASKIDEDETAVAEGFELPGADLSNEELSVRVLPKQNDEFTCMECFLVRHRSQLASEEGGVPICTDCAG